MRKETWRGRVLIWGVFLLAAAWVAFLSVPYLAGRDGPTDTLEYRLLDLRHTLVGPLSPATDLAIVAIDDATLNDERVVGQSRRALLALLIEAIAQSDAKAVVLDVLLADPGDVQEDQALADALSLLPSVIAGAVSFDPQGSAQMSLIWPQDVFAASAKAGLVNLSTDAAGTPRYAPLLVTAGQRPLPSLILLAALSQGGVNASVGASSLSLNDTVIPLDHGLNMPLRYLGPAGTVPTTTARVLLDGPAPELLSGKRVVLGFSAAAMGDRFATPFDDSMPGMEVIATAISQLTGGPIMARDTWTRASDVGHAAVLTLLSLLILALSPLSRGLLVFAALAALSFLVATLFFASGIWLSAALPLVAAIPPAALITTLRYRQEREEANRSEKTVASLRRFQSPTLARRIERDPNYLSAPEEQVLVVFFVDLTGFTGLSQNLGPEGTRNLLQKFHRLCAQAIESHDGSVFNYMGDGVMAVFGLDGDESFAADAALDASVDLTRALSRTRLEEAPNITLECRIGLHRGLVTLSRLGGDSHQQVTVTGDTVNFASRLMEVAKTEAAVIVASQALCDALEAAGKTSTARQTEVTIRGRAGQEPVFVWSQDALIPVTG